MHIPTTTTIARAALTDEDKTRLESLAPQFDIRFTLEDDGSYQLQVDEQASVRLPQTAAHKRLFNEICSKCIHWIPFNLMEAPRDTFFKRDAKQMARLVELYHLKKEKTCQRRP